MSNIPPPNFAQYPRQGMGPDAATLRLLADGYYGLNTAFIINVVMNFGSRGISGVAGQSSQGAALGIIAGYVLLMFIVITAITLPHNKKIGEGLGWSSSGPLVASLLMGLNSALCCGIIGYIVVQGMAAKKFKEAGIPRGFFGYKKVEVYNFINQLS
jgi:hypothetical protein